MTSLSSPDNKAQFQKVADRIFALTLIAQLTLASAVFLTFIGAYSIARRGSVEKEVQAVFREMEKKITESIFVEESITGKVEREHSAAKIFERALRGNGVEAQVYAGKCDENPRALRFSLSVGERVLTHCIFVAPASGFLSYGFAWMFFAGLISLLVISSAWLFVRNKINLRVISPLIEKIETTSKEAVMGRIAAQVAHDVRSPLSVIQIVAQAPNNLPEEQKQLLRLAADKINKIADDLLTHNRRSNIDEATEFASVLTILERVASEKRTLFAERKAEIKIEAENEAMQSFVLCSDTKLSRVISNLVQNGVEAVPQNKIPQIFIRLSQMKRFLNLKITDNGKGIPSSVVSSLGMKGLSVGKEKGNGLGLWDAMETLKSIGGELLIKTKEGEGTTINLKIPFAATPYQKPFTNQLQER